MLIDSNKVAYGVLYRRHGIIQIAHASKEVIISAGTISSPMLLIKSGIGPKEILEKAEVPIATCTDSLHQFEIECNLDSSCK